MVHVNLSGCSSLVFPFLSTGLPTQIIASVSALVRSPDVLYQPVVWICLEVVVGFVANCPMAKDCLVVDCYRSVTVCSLWGV